MYKPSDFFDAVWAHTGTHAVRFGTLHRVLQELSEDPTKPRSEVEARLPSSWTYEKHITDAEWKLALQAVEVAHRLNEQEGLA